MLVLLRRVLITLTFFPGRLGEVKFGYDTFFRARWSLVLSLTEVYIAYSSGTFTVLISRWRIIIGGGH